LRRKKLRNGPLFSAALAGDTHVLLAPRLDVLTENKSEDQVLAREAKRLLQVLRTSSTENSPLVQNFEQFVADN
jgi:hypothetical protein